MANDVFRWLFLVFNWKAKEKVIEKKVQPHMFTHVDSQIRINCTFLNNVIFFNPILAIVFRVLVEIYQKYRSKTVVSVVLRIFCMYLSRAHET